MTESPQDTGASPGRSDQVGRRVGRTLSALALVAAAVVIAYFTGRSQGSQEPTVVTATPPPATVTVAPTTSASTSQRPTSSSTTRSAPPASPNGEVYLTDRTPIEGGSSVEVGSATVRYQEYPRALVFSSASTSVSYNVDPGMRTFRSLIAMTDDSASCTLSFDVKVDGTTVRRETVQVGQTVELMAPLNGGFRLTLSSSYNDSCSEATPVVINPVLRPE